MGLGVCLSSHFKNGLGRLVFYISYNQHSRERTCAFTKRWNTINSCIGCSKREAVGSEIFRRRKCCSNDGSDFEIWKSVYCWKSHQELEKNKKGCKEEGKGQCSCSTTRSNFGKSTGFKVFRWMLLNYF